MVASFGPYFFLDQRRVLAILWKSSAPFIPASSVFSIALLVASSGTNSFSATQEVRPPLVIDSKVEHYDITGSTAQELSAAMLAKGIREGNRRAFSRMTYAIQYSVQPFQYLIVCEIVNVWVTVKTTILLPRWKDPPVQASRRLIVEWNNFVEALTVHERGHQQISHTTGQELLRGLLSMPPLRCREFEQRVKEFADRIIIQKHDEEQERYNGETNYGGNQGAIWPPESRGRR